MIKKVFILNNRYHYDILFNHLEKSKNYNSLILFEEEVPLKPSKYKIKINSLFRFNSKDNIIIKLRKIILIKKFVSELKVEFSDNCIVYLGSDKQLFNQIFLSAYKFRYVNLFDEGIGLYRERFFKSKIYNLLYWFISNLLFQISIYYVQPLGSHPKVNNIFVRRKELLQYKRTNVNYTYLNYKLSKKISKNNKVILLLPYNEKTKISQKLQISHFKDLVYKFTSFGFKVDIKPHPRDNYVYKNIFLNQKNIKIIDKEILSEKLNLQSFEWIINYRSSSILNLIFNKYKTDKILTISFDKNHLTDKIYPNIFYFNKKIEIENFIHNKLNKI